MFECVSICFDCNCDSSLDDIFVDSEELTTRFVMPSYIYVMFYVVGTVLR